MARGGNMRDLEALLQGDLVGGDMDGDLVGDLLGDMDGDLVGDLLGDTDGDLVGLVDPRQAMAQARVFQKLRGGAAHLNPQEAAWLRKHLLGNQADKRALVQLIHNFRAGAQNVRNAPPLINRTPGVPSTTQSRGFLPFQAEGGTQTGSPALVFDSTVPPIGIFIAKPQRPTKLARLVADQIYNPAAAESDPTLLVITDIKVGQTSIMAGSGGMPLSMFRPEVMNSQFNGVSAGPGVEIILQIQMLGTIPATAQKTCTLGGYADQVV